MEEKLIAGKNLEMEYYLSEIRKFLIQEKFEEAVRCLESTRLRYPDYEKREKGYLIDFAQGQALFRKYTAQGKFPAGGIDKIISLFSKSSSLKEDFSDTHFLMHFAYMKKFGEDKSVEQKEDSRKKAIYHSVRAKKLNSDLTEECNKSLECLIDIELLLCNPHEEIVQYWKKEFNSYPKVKVISGDILKQNCDAIVSPANSFGFMDGGLDFNLSEYFGWNLEKKLQKDIREKYGGELNVGQAIIIETKNKKIPYLISSPTMRVPVELPEESINAYLAARAVFLAIENYNKINKKISKVAMPMMCSGVMILY